METLAHQPVFPNEERTSQFADVPNSMMTGGLTKREYFAGLALQGILANAGGWLDEDIAEKQAKIAVDCADALIEALNKKKEEQ